MRFYCHDTHFHYQNTIAFLLSAENDCISIIRIRLHFYCQQKTIAFPLSENDCISIVSRIRLHFNYQNTIAFLSSWHAFLLSEYDFRFLVQPVSAARVRLWHTKNESCRYNLRILPFYSQDRIPDLLYTRVYCESSCVTHTLESSHLYILRIWFHTHAQVMSHLCNTHTRVLLHFYSQDMIPGSLDTRFYCTSSCVTHTCESSHISILRIRSHTYTRVISHLCNTYTRGMSYLYVTHTHGACHICVQHIHASHVTFVCNTYKSHVTVYATLARQSCHICM